MNMEPERETAAAKRRIYLDNACTTFPKPPQVAEAVSAFLTGIGANVARGSYGSAYDAEEAVFETRDMLSDLFDGYGPRHVVFTKNVTESLNVLLKGLLKPGDHVLVSQMEHNAVMRPLTQLTEKGVAFDRIPCDRAGRLLLEEADALVRPETRAVVMMHASNVCGTVLPIREVGEFCRERGLLFLVDSAQTAGVLPISMKEMHIDALAFTGHKGLMGPQGIGGFLLRKGLEKEIEPLLSGGTGSFSHLETVPEVMPDRFEPGTMNLPGIYGLRAGLVWIREIGIDVIHQRETKLTARFLAGVREMEEAGLYRLCGLPGTEGRVGVVSLVPLLAEQSLVCAALDDVYGIQTRGGLHCAPSAHRALGTFPEGTVRFSAGYFTTEEEIDAALAALREVQHGL
ncbi:MAG: aminotransferase class V-fold PLP-dependent enzyme [Lachnospiraceae bacterium]|nr:aminotransferase class V-fold PLP-dependent enzyme [Lachnospiraceae bacterium]